MKKETKQTTLPISDYDALKALVESCNPYHNYTFAEDIEEDIIYHLREYENDDDAKMFFEDLLKYGCQSGAVLMFLYTEDCKNFYIEHIDDMEEFLRQYEDELCEYHLLNHSNLPRYTQMCWFCYEELARAIYENMFPEN